jgi:secreted effector protein SseC
MDKAVEQQDKTKKAGIFNVIFDWVIAAIEGVTGALKIGNQWGIGHQ